MTEIWRCDTWICVCLYIYIYICNRFDVDSASIHARCTFNQVLVIIPSIFTNIGKGCQRNGLTALIYYLLTNYPWQLPMLSCFLESRLNKNKRERSVIRGSFCDLRLGNEYVVTFMVLCGVWLLNHALTSKSSTTDNGKVLMTSYIPLFLRRCWESWGVMAHYKVSGY